MITRILSQSFLNQSLDVQSLVDIVIFERYIQIIGAHADRKTPLDMRELNDAAAFDFVTSFIFGTSFGTNLLEDALFRQEFLGHHYNERSQGLWRQELPALVNLAKRLHLDVTTRSARWLQEWFLHAYKLSKAGVATGTNGTRAILLEHLLPKASTMARQAGIECGDLAVVSELHDHGIAGSETTGQMVTKAMQALSQRPVLQERLRSELLSHFDSVKHPMKPVELGQLRLLHAIVIETLRHRQRGPFPREPPQQAVTVAGCPNLPPKTKVSLYSHVIHHDKEVFQSPDDWDPLRWLGGRGQGYAERCGKEGRNFLAFGVGDRSCVGRDLALFKMKALLAPVYCTYRTSLADEEARRYQQPYSANKFNKMHLVFERA